MTMQFSASTVVRNYDLQQIIAFGIGRIWEAVRMKFADKIVRVGFLSAYFISEILIQASALFS